MVSALTRAERNEDRPLAPLLALAYHQLGQTNEANQALSEARGLLGNRFPEGLVRGLPTRPDPVGSWHAWIESLLLLNEATEAVDGVTPPALIPVGVSESSGE